MAPVMLRLTQMLMPLIYSLAFLFFLATLPVTRGSTPSATSSATFAHASSVAQANLPSPPLKIAPDSPRVFDPLPTSPPVLADRAVHAHLPRCSDGQCGGGSQLSTLVASVVTSTIASVTTVPCYITTAVVSSTTTSYTVYATQHIYETVVESDTVYVYDFEPTPSLFLTTSQTVICQTVIMTANSYSFSGSHHVETSTAKGSMSTVGASTSLVIGGSSGSSAPTPAGPSTSSSSAQIGTPAGSGSVAGNGAAAPSGWSAGLGAKNGAATPAASATKSTAAGGLSQGAELAAMPSDWSARSNDGQYTPYGTEGEAGTTLSPTGGAGAPTPTWLSNSTNGTEKLPTYTPLGTSQIPPSGNISISDWTQAFTTSTASPNTTAAASAAKSSGAQLAPSKASGASQTSGTEVWLISLCAALAVLVML